MAELDGAGADYWLRDAEDRIAAGQHPDIDTAARRLRDWRISQRTDFYRHPATNAKDFLARIAAASADVEATPLHPDFDTKALLTALHKRILVFGAGATGQTAADVHASF